jgi:hypothetical protein
MIRYLAENTDYKVYSIYENVYLKNKKTSNNFNDFEESDILITSHYGDPNNAIILHKNNYVIVSGCGLTIYDVGKNSEKNILAEPEEITWTNTVFQDETDDQIFEFRFVAFNKSDNLRIFKMNLETYEITEM